MMMMTTNNALDRQKGHAVMMMKFMQQMQTLAT